MKKSNGAPEQAGLSASAEVATLQRAAPPNCASPKALLSPLNHPNTSPPARSTVGGVGPGAALAGGVFAVSRLVWQWSMAAEVFSLNNLFVGLLFSLCACFHHADSAPQRRKFAQWGALCCGLGLCNQHTLVLYIVVIVPWVLLRLHSHQELSLRVLTQLGLCFLGGFLPYLYLPVSSYWNTARWSWGDQTSLHGLLTHLLRAEYGTFSLAKTDSPASLATMLQAHLDHCMADLPLPVLILAGVALFLSPLNRRRCVLPWLLAGMLLLYSLFFAWRANLDISKPLLLGVVERFWLQSDAVLCVLAGLGLSVLVEGLERRLGLGGCGEQEAGPSLPDWWHTWPTPTTGEACLGRGAETGLGPFSNQHRIRALAQDQGPEWAGPGECDQSRNDVVERFARGLLDSIPQNSIVLTRGDLPGNTLRYLHYCQGLRPDVSLVDQEMMTYRWYVAKLGHHHHKVHFPGHWWDPVQWEEKRTFSLEQFLLHNSQRAVFACIGLPDGDPSWQRSFSRWPWGICDQLVPVQARFHPEEWARRTRNMYNWTEPHDSFHPGTWERVANEEMWQARMKTAFFLFDLAEKVEGEAKTRLFELSYTLYKEIVEEHKDHPSNWDKNMALASERLLRSGARGHNPDNLLTQSIEHFTLYLEKEPTDPQADAIRAAISHLLKERQRLRERHSS
ncbi:hypothetical protein MATL_G00164750 [Megalops atlanticus]|uniref:Transmembrane protein 260 n=1 Tax=Megalops atlanticus TaxID=7932 RepID=A0A9D3PRZ0_MEGAT|nr:hypothetical protein MATL_G00164750 [Megalops atlanticus]